MNTIIRWEEPPEKRGGGSDSRTPATPRLNPWVQVIQDLNSNPGRSALIYIGGSGTASGLACNIRRGEGPWAPRGRFDACSRKGDDGLSRTYAWRRTEAQR